MDHDRNTSPVSFEDVLLFQGIGRVGQTEEFHFPNDPFRSSLGNIRDDIAAQARGERRADDLERFGRHLHTLEDIGFVDAPGPHMRHDPGRPVQRILAPTLGMVGLALSSGMLVASIHLFESNLGKGGKAVLGVLIFAVMGYGIYILAFAIRADNIGHPSYRTERGNESTSFSHAADEAIVRAIAAMAATLGIAVAAEGVESEAQLKRLLALGCEEWQGHYFSAPLDAAAFEKLLLNVSAGSARTAPRR